MAQPILIEGREAAQVTASVGVALAPEQGREFDRLFQLADLAMYEAKHKGIGVAVYDRSLDHNKPERLGLVADLSQAIQERQLCLYFQPKLDLASGRQDGYEALLRWQHPRQGLLLPEAFLPQAELSEIIHPLTDLVLDLALAQLRRWRDAGLDVSVSVNLSARNLVDDRCLHTLARLLAQYRIEPGGLEVEITETALMHDPEQAALRLDRIAALGVRVCIDDYGTGYSSLGYLHRLPIHALKIDRLFVGDMLENEHDAIIVRSTIALAHSLGLKVVAEGVENRATLDLLRGMGCDQIQGYLLAPPMSPEQVPVADTTAGMAG